MLNFVLRFVEMERFMSMNVMMAILLMEMDVLHHAKLRIISNVIMVPNQVSASISLDMQST